MEKMHLWMGIVVLGLGVCIGLVATQKKPIVAEAPKKQEVLPPSEPAKPPEKPKLADPDFIDVPKVSDRIKEDSFYADCINHADDPYLQHGRGTQAHESTHDINSKIRNKLAPKPNGYNGFYVGGGKGVVVKEPNFKIAQIIEFLPKPLRSYRYQLYLVQQQSGWNDMPTYMFDEWVAYVNGGLAEIEDAEEGRKTEHTDAVSGCVDFTIYSIATCMACEKHDPDYWKNETQFKRFVHWHLKRAQEVFARGHDRKEFLHNEGPLYTALLNDPAAQPMRDFVNKHFDGLWLSGPVADKFR